jgi:hypothetical protein
MHGVVVQGPLLRGPRARHKQDRQIGKVKKVTGSSRSEIESQPCTVSEVRLTAVGCAQLSD